MKKPILAAALALAISAGATTPAYAADGHGEWINIESTSWFASNPFTALIALLLPAVQSAPPAR